MPGEVAHQQAEQIVDAKPLEPILSPTNFTSTSRLASQQTFNNYATPYMPIALFVIFGLVSIFSIYFIVRKYKAATPVQKRQIIIAAGGAISVAILIYFLFT